MMIQLTNVTAGYGHKLVFSDLNLKINRGSFTGIVGPSGAGKSTLLRVILGLKDYVSGKVGIFDDSKKSGNTSVEVGYVTQGSGIDNYFPVTVEQVISMGFAGGAVGFSPWLNRREKQRVASVAERLGISTFLQHHVGDISGGQRQRTFLARALICKPQLLILDEPTSGIDLNTQQTILNLLSELNSEGMTVLMTTHDLNGVACRLPNVLCFNHGVIAEGVPKKVFTNSVLKKTFGEGLSSVTYRGKIIITNDSMKPSQVMGYGSAF